MTSDDLNQAMERHDVSSVELALLTGTTPRQVRNWRSGRAAVPVYVATIFDLIDGHHAALAAASVC